MQVRQQPMLNKIKAYWDNNYMLIGMIIIISIIFLILISTLPTEIKIEKISQVKQGKCLIRQDQSISEFECEITPTGATIDFNKDK